VLSPRKPIVATTGINSWGQAPLIRMVTPFLSYEYGEPALLQDFQKSTIFLKIFLEHHKV